MMKVILILLSILCSILATEEDQPQEDVHPVVAAIEAELHQLLQDKKNELLQAKEAEAKETEEREKPKETKEPEKLKPKESSPLEKERRKRLDALYRMKLPRHINPRFLKEFD